MRHTAIAIGIAAAAGLASSASAAIYASSVELFNQGLNSGGQPVVAERSNPNLALGAPQNNDTINFVSLGFGGSLTLGFDMPFTLPSAIIIETTYGNASSHPEAALVYVGVGSDAASATYYLVGQALNTTDSIPLSLQPVVDNFGVSVFNYLRIVDNTHAIYPSSPSDDGFDVDGVVVTPIPTPGALALTAMSGVCVLRRRRN